MRVKLYLTNPNIASCCWNVPSFPS